MLFPVLMVNENQKRVCLPLMLVIATYLCSTNLLYRDLQVSSSFKQAPDGSKGYGWWNEQQIYERVRVSSFIFSQKKVINIIIMLLCWMLYMLYLYCSIVEVLDLLFNFRFYKRLHVIELSSIYSHYFNQSLYFCIIYISSALSWISNFIHLTQNKILQH